jgi:hypothetical protein
MAVFVGYSDGTANECRPSTTDRKGYNNGVDASVPPKAHAGHQHRHRHSIYAAEDTGLLLMAVLLLILTLIRYWRDIPWSAR